MKKEFARQQGWISMEKEAWDHKTPQGRARRNGKWESALGKGHAGSF